MRSATICLFMSAGLLVSPGLLGCTTEDGGADSASGTGSGDGDGDGDTGDDDGMGANDGVPARGGIAIERVEINQAVGIDLARDGQWVGADGRIAPVVRNRQAVVRAFWTIPADWQPREMEGRLHLRYADGTETFKTYTVMVDGPSDPADTQFGAFGFLLAAEEVEPDMEFYVDLWETGDGAGLAETGPTTSPTEGYAPVGVQAEPLEIKATLVPVKYDVGGCSTDTSTFTEDELESFRQYMFDVNAVNDVIITLDEPIIRTTAISSPTEIWSSVSNRKSANGAAPNEYYYGIYDDCGAPAGVLGVAPTNNLPATMENGGVRYAAGRWFPDAPRVGLETFVHEIGHVQSRPHTQCPGVGEPNAPAGPDPAYPYPNGEIGVWGLNPSTFQGYSPDDGKDYMGYCDPAWVSDYTYVKTFSIIRTLTSWDYASVAVPAPGKVLQGWIDHEGNEDWWIVDGHVDFTDHGSDELTLALDDGEHRLPARVDEIADMEWAHFVQVPLDDDVAGQLEARLADESAAATQLAAPAARIVPVDSALTESFEIHL